MKRDFGNQSDPGELLERYRRRIPADLQDILLPDHSQAEAFATAIRRLRIKEEERAYVTEIQQRYGLDLRPNESVKRTMIRARLVIIKERMQIAESDPFMDIHDRLPTDPLE